MKYDWKCRTCKATTQVERRMSDSDKGPVKTCGICGEYNFFRPVQAPLTTIFVGGRSENGQFPMRLSHIEKKVEVKDSSGKVIGFRKEPIIVHNKAQYNEALARRDMVMMADGEDPMVGPSQRSVYDEFNDPPAPSDRAKYLAENVTFVEDTEGLEEYGIHL